MNDLGLMPSDRVTETLQRLGERVDATQVNEKLVTNFSNREVEAFLTDIAVNIDYLTSQEISDRIDELGDEGGLSGLNNPSNNNANRRRRTNQPQTQAAVAAGDEDNIKSGVWGVPFYGNATQKSRNGASGYKSNTGGGIVGFDYAVNDSTVIGAAYTRAESRLRHKNDKVGDKTKAGSDVYSIYGLYNFLTNNFFIEGIGSYGSSRIKNYEKRITSTGVQTATGKFNNTSYTGELLGGYNYLVNHFSVITPMLVVRYATFKNSSYKETGTSFQNLSVRKNSYDRLEGLFGLKGTANLFIDDINVRPSLHGFINYAFENKLPNIDARLDGIDEPLATIKFNPTKLNYNLGGGVSTRYNMMEFGIRYNLSLAKKYIANY